MPEESDISQDVPEPSVPNESPHNLIKQDAPPQRKGFVQKDARELLQQLAGQFHTKQALEIVDEVGYDDEKVREKLKKMADEDPDEYKWFLKTLRGQSRLGKGTRQQEAEVAQTFTNFIEGTESSDQIEQQREEIQRKIFRIDGDQNPEDAVQNIRDAFPSGNYLVHGTSINGALKIVEAGAIKSIGALRKDDPKMKSRGGYSGISFSYDGVGALPGTDRHMTMFLTSPELALNDETKLSVPLRAALYEMQLVDREYDRELQANYESLFDFMTEQHAWFGAKFEKGELDEETARDLERLKNGEITEADVQEKYAFVEGKLHVDPSVIEGSVAPGLLWIDFVLRNTDYGQQLGKKLEDLSPNDIQHLFKNTEYIWKEQVDTLKKLSDSQSWEDDMSIDLNDTVLMIPDSDIEVWVDILARSQKRPRAVMAFSSLSGPRVPNWKKPEGHSAKAAGAIEVGLQKCGVPEPSLQFEEVIGSTLESSDNAGKSISYLKWDKIRNAKEMIKEDEEIHLV